MKNQNKKEIDKMKKLTCFALALLMALSLTACGGNKDQNDNVTTPAATTDTTTETPATTEDPSASLPTNTLDLLNTVWGSYADDEKFAVSGGDSENMVMDAPGKIVLENIEKGTLDWLFCFPEDYTDKIDGAASLMHMMNANTFTCSAFHVKKAEDITGLAAALRDNMQARQWMCGFPDKLVVIQLDQYVISMFGKTPVDTFRDKLLSAYPDAVILHEEAIQ